MEPLPKERSDRTTSTVRVMWWVPQWSRSRRSGATPGRDGRLPGAVRASMEPLPKERSDAKQADVTGLAEQVASMEPLPKERSDAAYRVYNAWPTSVPQWSRSRRSGATGHHRHGQHPGAGLNGAAPEGAERLVEEVSVSATPEGLNGAAPEGAERPVRPRQPGTVAIQASMEPLPKERSDIDIRPIVRPSSMPQWSRSRRSGATGVTNDRARDLEAAPQWSRSRRSGATSLTRNPRERRPCLNGAAPEGAERPGSHRPGIAGSQGLNGAAPEGAERRMGPSSSCPTGQRLNGAAPEGAERRAPAHRGTPRHPPFASMEPLPKERSDGSQKTRHLTCDNAPVCEHLRYTRQNSSHYAVAKKRKGPLTCMRALPGI